MSVVDTKLIYNSSPLLPFVQDINALYITDSNTTALLKASENYCPSIPHIELNSGEEHKNLQNIEKILKKAIEAKINRNGRFIGVGGGVILDMTGFAASVYMRGIDSIYVPTTLLAMVDAAIGGKTGVDFQKIKNIVGAFHLPKEVYICSDYLNSLNAVQYKSGLAEMLKIALINRPAIYHTLCKHLSEIKEKIDSAPTIERATTSIELIKEAIEGKMEIVAKDFDEKHERMYLNFGHTFAHALEAALDFSDVTHGEAVAWGISRSLSLGVLLGKTEEKYRDEVVSLIASLGYSSDPIPQQFKKKLLEKTMCKDKSNAFNAIASLLIEKMKCDKKNKSKKICLVLQKQMGYTFTEEVDESYIKEVLI